LPSHPLLLGHRGARHYAPENTLAAFDIALRHGADGFEFDVRCTRDRQTILCHDPKLNRLVLRRHTLKRIQDSCSERDGMPPTLEDVLDRYRREFLNIEVKVRGIEPVIVAAVKRVRPKDYFISSFRPGVVRRLHALEASLTKSAVRPKRKHGNIPL